MIGLQTTSTLLKLTSAVSNNLATANNDGSLFDEASSMLKLQMTIKSMLNIC